MSVRGGPFVALEKTSILILDEIEVAASSEEYTVVKRAPSSGAFSICLTSSDQRAVYSAARLPGDAPGVVNRTVQVLADGAPPVDVSWEPSGQLIVYRLADAAADMIFTVSLSGIGDA